MRAIAGLWPWGDAHAGNHVGDHEQRKDPDLPLEAFHGRKLTLESRENGARLVRDEDLDSKLSAGGIFRWFESRIGPPEGAPKAGGQP